MKKLEPLISTTSVLIPDSAVSGEPGHLRSWTR
jgi:hypothetical protein